jgi:hypothetical protein
MSKSAGHSSITELFQHRKVILHSNKVVISGRKKGKQSQKEVRKCEFTFPPPILQKQHCPSALQRIGCTPADY